MGAKDDKKNDASKNKDDKKKIDGESVTVVLKLDLHCEGCAKKVKSSIRHFKGVESVNADMAGNKITVTGKVDPAQVKERIEKKTKKKVEIVSPQVKKDDKKSDEKSPEKKSDDKKADAKKSDEKGNNGGDGEKKKDSDKDKKKDEVKADASRSGTNVGSDDESLHVLNTPGNSSGGSVEVVKDGIKRRRRDLFDDGVRIMATTLGRGQLKEDLESST
nr:heavy metal-associated domain, HMA [Tanacetum cinerariifolium]